MKSRLFGLICLLSLGITAPFNASAVSTGTYNLANHPDAGQNPPPYGLRLDGLLGYGVYTFDFEDAASNMKLAYHDDHGSEIHITGTALGGSDTGSGYAGGSTAVWDINFTFDTGVTQPGGEGGLDDIIVDTSGDHANSGTITSSLGSFDLRSHANSTETFILGDEDGSGHRGFNGISGWGWLDYSEAGQDDWKGNDNGETADFIFTATVVPVPAAVWLFGSGLIGLAGLARRRAHS